MTIQPSGLVLLATVVASIFQYLAASVNSASTSRPFGNRPMAPLLDQRKRLIAQGFQWGERPGRDNVHTVHRPHRYIFRPARHGLAPERRLCAPPRAGRRPFCHCSRPGGLSRPASRPAHKQSESPGTHRRSRGRPRASRPARDRGAGANRRRAGSRYVGIVDGEIRVGVCCHFSSRSTNSSSRFCVSRETGVSASARALSAARSTVPCPRALTLTSRLRLLPRPRLT